MRTFDIIATAASNLKRNKTRTTLTIIAVFVGATTITLTNGIGDGIKSYMNRQISSLGTNGILITTIKNDSAGKDDTTPKLYNPTKVKSAAQMGPQSHAPNVLSPFLLTGKDMSKIKQTDGVQSVAPVANLTLDYITASSAKNADKYQVDAQMLGNDFFTFDIANGQQLNAASSGYEVLLPSNYVGVLGFSSSQHAVGKTVQLHVTNQYDETRLFDAKVVGVVNKSFIASNKIVLGKKLADEATSFQNQGKPESQKDLYAAVLIKFDTSYTQTEIDSLKNRLGDEGYSAKTIRDEQKTVFAVIDAIVIVLNMFGVVALVAASFGIVNTLFMAVQERTKEIGLMKAVGMSRAKIFSLFSIEAALLGLIGSTGGVIAASLLGKVINKVASTGFLKDFEGLNLLAFELASLLGIIGVITLIAFLSGTLPARRASKLDAITALRYE